MSNGKTYLGVDIGGTSVKLGLVDEQGIFKTGKEAGSKRRWKKCFISRRRY